MMLTEGSSSRSRKARPRRSIVPPYVRALQWPGSCLLLAGVLLAVVAYAASPPGSRLDFPVDQLPLGVSLRNTYGIEHNAAGAYVWTKAMTPLSLPVDHPGRYRLALTMENTPIAEKRLVRVFANGQLLGAFIPDTTLRPYALDWELDGRSWRPGSSELRLDLEVAPFFPPNDARPLGMILARVALTPIASAYAPSKVVACWLALVMGMLLIGQLGGIAWRLRAAMLAVGTMSMAGVVVWDRAAAWWAVAQPLIHPWFAFNLTATVSLVAIAIGPTGRHGGTAVPEAGIVSPGRELAGTRRVTIRETINLLRAALPLAWAAIVAIATARQASVAWESLGVLLRLAPRRVESLQFVGVIFAYALLGTCVIRATRPTLTIPVMIAIFAVGCTAFAVGTGAIGDLVLLIVLVGCWLALGHAALLLLGVRLRECWERGVLAFALGSGFFALWVLAIGSLGLLSAPLILGPALLLALGLLIRRLSAPQRAFAGRWRTRWIPSWLETILLGQLVGFALIGCSVGFGPEVMSDAFRVHLVIARQFAAEHRVFGIAEQGLSSSPIQGQLLYTAGMVLRGVGLAKLIDTATGLAVIAGVGVGGYRLGRSRTAGIVAAALFAGLPVVLWELGVGYADLFEVLYGVVALLCLLRLLVSPNWRWSLLLGMALGFGVAAKLRASFRIGGVGLALIVGYAGRLRLAALPRLLLTLASGFALSCGAWVLRSIWLTHTVPVLSPVLGVLGIGAATTNNPVDDVAGFGIGHGVGALMRLPWSLSLDSSLFSEQEDGFVGFALLCLLPCLLALPRRRRVWAALGFTAVSFLLWFLTAQYIRYLLPTLAALASVLGAAVIFLGRRLARYRLVGRLASRAYAAALSGILLSSLVFYFATFFLYPGSLPVRVVLGRESQDSYLAFTLGNYEATRQLDQLVAPGTAVAALPDGPGLYTHARLITPFRVDAGLIWAESIPQLLALFRRYDMHYLLIEHAAIPASWSGFLITSPEFLQNYTDRVFVSAGTTIYRLRPAAGVTPGGELLRDPGFEERQGRAGPWQPIGAAPVPTRDAPPHQGGHAIVVDGRAGYYQPVGVRGGRGYLLRYAARSDQPDALAELRIDWFNSDGILIRSSASAVPLTPEWAEYSLWRPAPAGATDGVVYVLARNNTICWFDGYSLQQID